MVDLDQLMSCTQNVGKKYLVKRNKKKIMGLPKKLTEQQIKFANILISEQGRKTATQCAIEAGYAKDSAESFA